MNVVERGLHRSFLKDAVKLRSEILHVVTQLHDRDYAAGIADPAYNGRAKPAAA